MRYKETDKSLPQIGQELNVDALIEGSVLRAGQRLRITIQLIHAATDEHLWAEGYERDLCDILSLQSEVAGAVAQEIRIKLTPQEHARLGWARPVDPEAHDAYLRGRYSWNRRTEEALKKSLEYFQQAIEKDPGYALGYAGLADAYVLLGSPLYGAVAVEATISRAKAAAEKALEIDGALVEARASLAYSLTLYGHDWLCAEAEFKRAIELDRNYATAHQWYSILLTVMGRHESAVAEASRARELDPLSPIINSGLGIRYYYARRYDAAIEQCRRMLDVEPGFAVAHEYLGRSYERQGSFGNAIAEFQKATSLSPTNPTYCSGLGISYALAGRTEEAVKVLEELKDLSKLRHVSAYHLAMVYAALGEKDRAFEYLRKAQVEHSGWMIYLQVEPRFDTLRDDSRFAEFVDSMGFPQTTNSRELR